MLKRIALPVLVAASVFALVLVANALRLPSRQVRVDPVTDIQVDTDRVAAHVAAAVRFRTVSSALAADVPDGEFLGLHR